MKKHTAKGSMRALVSFGSVTAFASVSAFAYQYTIQKGDTLSHIAAKNIPGRLYGQSGSLQKLLSQNPQIHDPDRIIPGQRLSFGEERTLSQGSAPTPDTIEEEVSSREAASSEAMKNTNPPNMSLVFDQQGLDFNKPKSRKPAALANETNLRSNESAAQKSSLPEEFTAAATLIEPLELKETQTHLTLAPAFSYRALTSTDSSQARAKALSKLGYGLHVDWTQSWDDTQTWQTAIGMDLIRYSFEVSENKTLSEKNYLYSKLFVAGRYHFAPKSHIEMKLGADRESVLTAESADALKIQSSLAPSLELSSALSFLKYKNLSMALRPTLGALLSSSTGFSTKTSLYYGASLGIDYERNWGRIQSTLQYRNLKLRSSAGEQSTQDLGIVLGVGFKL